MSNPVWRVVRALTGDETGADCRRCGESIDRADAFGRSERVCSPCRR